jgi:hypothetical protein
MEVLFVVAAGVIGLAAMIWHFQRSDSIVEDWAQANGYRLVSKQYCWFWKGPYFLRSSKGQTVYYVTVMDNEGQERRGSVRCGSWFWGIWSNQVDFMWDIE